MPMPKISADDSVHHSYFLKSPKSTIELWEAALPTLKEESKQCIGNLLNCDSAPHTRAKFPWSRSAAVLVPLFIGRAGDLYVLLSRRSESLRQFAGDTALPGGKAEAQDLTAENTARREAFEEIGLAQDRERVPLLCVMDPFLGAGQIVVTPVVVLILDKTMQLNLNESEVTSIFSRPLASFLMSSFPFPRDRASADPSTPYYTMTDLKWNEGTGEILRLHRFLTGREADGVKPVFGLTASILICTAVLGYRRAPDFEFHPPGELTPAQQIAAVLVAPGSRLRLACEREGIDVDEVIARVLHPLEEPNSEPRMVEQEMIGQDWGCSMENIPGGAMSKGVVPSTSGTQEPNQQHVDVSGMNTSGEGSDSDAESDLNGRKEQVRRGEQPREQGKLKPDKSTLSEHVDRSCNVMNSRGAKL